MNLGTNRQSSFLLSGGSSVAAPCARVFASSSQIKLVSQEASSIALSCQSVCPSGLELARSLPQPGGCLPSVFTPLIASLLNCCRSKRVDTAQILKDRR